MKKTFVALIAVIGILFLATELFLFNVVRTHHPGWKDAKDTEAASKGWIASVISPFSFIEKTRNPGLNAGYGKFRFDRKDAEFLRARLSSVDSADAITRLGVNRKDYERRGYSFFVDRRYLLAINWNEGSGEFWLDYWRP